MRPNIRVEIENNLVESMEVDENEEGEISDRDETATEKHGQIQFQDSNETLEPSPLGITLLNKQDEGKLQERAKRFCLNPEEIKNFKDEDLQILRSSLGITLANESNVRFEVIHMRGIDHMTAGDILDYFLEYAPVLVEWIDEESCNVVWKDSVSSARALHFISKAVRGMPVRDDSSYFDSVQEEVDQSVLLINKNREIELKDDEETPNKLLNERNSVDISEITATIPPGYWRLGGNHAKSKCLLLRFALKSDKKHVKEEHFGRYYKNQGKMKGAKHETHGIFGRNKDMRNENPWTVLAKNWDEDAQFRERERNQEMEMREVKNNSLRNRLGMKRKEEPEEPEEEAPKKKVKIPRMRMYADEEEEKIKRKQMLQRINNQIEKIDKDKSTNSDLRAILNMTSRTHGVKLEKNEPEVFDLGSRLKNRNKKMVFQIKSEEIEEGESRETPKNYRDRGFQRRKPSTSEDEDTRYSSRGKYSHKPKSKVAVVIKTQKKPAVASAVASTVWSRVSEKENSESESESESEEESSRESEEIEEFVERKITANRPGFTARSKDESIAKSAYKNPLKIEISNDHFKKS